MWRPIRRWFYSIVVCLTLFDVTKARTVSAFVDGDVIIAGLFDLHKGKGGKCDERNTEVVRTLDAIRWYIQQLNSKGALPFKLGLRGYDTCGVPGTAVQTALDIIYKYKNQQDSEKYLLGFLSMVSNEETLSLEQVLSSTPPENRYLHMSTSAGLTELGNRTLYPNFFRVVPDDTKLVEAIIKLLKGLGWNRIGIIYENLPSWRSLANALKQSSEENAVCIAKTTGINTNDFGDVYTKQIHAALGDVLKNVPSIEGVVYLGGKNVARNVLERSEHNFGLAYLPTFILAGCTGKDTDVFHTIATGDLLTKTKGSLVVVPSFTQIATYIDYRKSLITETEDNGSNELYIKYGIIAAHTIAKIARDAFKVQCKYDCRSTTIKPASLISRMKSAVIDFSTDFNVSVLPLSSSGYKLKFDGQASPTILSDDDVYQVYNFTHGSGAKMGFQKVGFMSRDDELNLNMAANNNHGQDHEEFFYYEGQKGQCPAGSKCTECFQKDVPDLHIHIPGDIYVIGIAPVYSKASDDSGCKDIYLAGYQYFRAIQYGLEMFKTKQRFEKYRSKFGNNTVGMIILNSCTNDLVIVRKILDLLKNGLDEGSGRRLNISGRILGFIGAFTSDVSLRTAEILTEMNHVQISYASTTPILSDNKKYPLFLRVVPSDKAQVEAILQVVKKLDGEFIQVIYAEKAYGEGALEYLESLAPSYNVCIKQSIKVERNDNFNKYYDEIQKEPAAKIIILFLNHQVLKPLLKALNTKMHIGDYHFIASDGWGKHKDLVEDNNIADGAITISLEMQEIDGLIPYIHNQTLSAYHKDPWLEAYLQKLQNCYYDFSFDKTLPQRCTYSGSKPPVIEFPSDEWIHFATVSVIALLTGTAEFYSKNCRSTKGLCKGFTGNMPGLVKEIKGLSMNIFGGNKRKLFDSNGDGVVGYSIYNVQKNKSADNVLTYVKVGEFDVNKELQLIVDKLNGNIKSPCPNDVVCKTCYNSTSVEPEVLLATDKKHTTSPEYPESLVIGLAVASGGLGLIVIMMLLWCGARNLKDKIYSAPGTPGTQYITPMEVDGHTNRATGSYNDVLLIEETRY